MKNFYSSISVKEDIIKNKSFDDISLLVHQLCDKYHNYQFDEKNPAVRLHEPTFGADETVAALGTMLTTRVTMGEKNKKLENEFSRKTKSKCAVTSNSGSSANLLAISALSNRDFTNYLNPGDEVIVPALSWSTTIWPLVQNGLVPVLVDVDIDTLNISIDCIKKALSNKTRAIMPVHVYGNPCNMNEILNISHENSLYLIEDCCEALGAKFKGKSVGSFGDVGTFSFYYSHHITTLEGGISITNNSDLDDLMRIIRAHGWIRESNNREKYLNEYPNIDPRFLFVNHGYNLRLNELQAAIGLEQIPKLNEIVKRRRFISNLYLKNLQQFDSIFGFQTELGGAESSWFGFPLLLKNSNINLKDLMTFLGKSGIESRPIICGNIAEQPALKKFPHRVSGNLKNSSKIMQSGFSIGCHQALSEDHVHYVVDRIKSYLR